LRGKIGLSTATSVHERVEGSLPERHRGHRMVMRVDADERCQDSAESLSALQVLKYKKILQLEIDRVETELMHQSTCSSVCNCSCRQTTALAVAIVAAYRSRGNYGNAVDPLARVSVNDGVRVSLRPSADESH